MYVTDNHSQWMTGLKQNYGGQNFNRFVLPGAHDAGMFDPSWINNPANLNALNIALAQLLGNTIGSQYTGLIQEVLSLINGYEPRFIEYMAFTQKESVSTLLDLGVRYFDFRPGTLAAPIQQNLPLDPTLYHQHNFIPGYPYESFLTDVLTWLKANPEEIVVISLSTNGFYDPSMNPSIDALQAAWTAAYAQAQSNVVIGGAADLNSPYNDLISQQKQVIFLNNSNIGDYYPATKYDTYNDADYATFTPETIINNVLDNMNTGDQKYMDYTVVQIQGTCTNALVTNIENEWNADAADCISDLGELIAACTDSEAASFLMSTKAQFDQQTYPWIYQNLNSHLLNDQLVIILNDFVDNALADICQALSLNHLQAS